MVRNKVMSRLDTRRVIREDLDDLLVLLFIYLFFLFGLVAGMAVGRGEAITWIYYDYLQNEVSFDKSTSLLQLPVPSLDKGGGLH